MGVVMLAIGFAICNLVGYGIYQLVYKLFFSPLLKIPGLEFHPLYGNMYESMKGEAMDSSVRWVKKFGGVVRFYHFLGAERVLFADPDSVRHVLVTNCRNYPRPGSAVIRELAPEGLFCIEGEIHRSERKLLNPLFNLTSIKKVVPLMHVKAQELTEKISLLVGKNSTQLNMQQYMTAVTMDIIGSVAFSYNFNAIENPHSEQVQSLSYLIQSQQMGLLSSFPLYRRIVPTTANRKLWKATKVVNEICYKILDCKRMCVEEKTILDSLMKAKYEGTDVGLTDKALRDHIVTFMLAGHETSSMTLSWLLLELARNATVEQKLYKEMKAKIPGDSSISEVSMETLESMKYLDACVKETLRLYPAAPAITRRALHDDIVNGYTIPSGTNVIVHLGTMMRTSFEDGEIFNPDRFLNSDSTKKSWLPFSIGPHMCIGNKFAVTEIKLLMCYLIMNFHIAPVPDLVIRRKYRLVLRPIPDVQLLVTKRL